MDLGLFIRQKSGVTLESVCSFLQQDQSDILYVHENILYSCPNIESLPDHFKIDFGEAKLYERFDNPYPTWTILCHGEMFWLFRQDAVSALTGVPVIH